MYFNMLQNLIPNTVDELRSIVFLGSYHSAEVSHCTPGSNSHAAIAPKAMTAYMIRRIAPGRAENLVPR